MLQASLQLTRNKNPGARDKERGAYRPSNPHELYSGPHYFASCGQRSTSGPRDYQRCHPRETCPMSCRFVSQMPYGFATEAWCTLCTLCTLCQAKRGLHSECDAGLWRSRRPRHLSLVARNRKQALRLDTYRLLLLFFCFFNVMTHRVFIIMSFLGVLECFFIGSYGLFGVFV